MNLEDLQERIAAGKPIPVGIVIYNVATEKITVSKMREAIAGCPEHPVAKTFQRVLDSLPKSVPEEMSFSVDSPDLQALKEKKNSRRVALIEDIGASHRYVVRKVVEGTFKVEVPIPPEPLPSFETDKTPKELAEGTP